MLTYFQEKPERTAPINLTSNYTYFKEHFIIRTNIQAFLALYDPFMHNLSISNIFKKTHNMLAFYRDISKFITNPYWT